jgi:hypothetical protein
MDQICEAIREGLEDRKNLKAGEEGTDATAPVVVEAPVVEPVVEEPVIKEKHVAFETPDNEEITIDLQQNIKPQINNKPQQNRQFSLNRMIKPVRRQISRFKLF